MAEKTNGGSLQFQSNNPNDFWGRAKRDPSHTFHGLQWFDHNLNDGRVIRYSKFVSIPRRTRPGARAGT